MATKKKKIYWLVREVLPIHRGRALLLEPEGFETRFATSIAEIEGEVRHKRAGIVILSDDRTKVENDANIRTIAEMPELKGARLILATQNSHPDNLKIAAAQCFRDFIPIAIPDDQWVKRFKYSVAGQGIAYVQPIAQLSVNNVSNVFVPCRIVWVSGNEIRIESRIAAPVGSKLRLCGPLAKELGLRHLTVTVKERQRDHLHYRFSDAMVATISGPDEVKARLEASVARLTGGEVKQLKRVFIAAKTGSLRGALLGKMTRDDFVVTSALHIQSMVNEPKYMTPDIVFVESALTEQVFAERFGRMLGTLRQGVPVIILGAGPEQQLKLKARFPDKTISFVDRVDENFERDVLDRVAPEPKGEAERFHIPASSNVSYGEIQLAARMRTIHPVVTQFTSSFEIGRFAIVRIASPILKSSVGRGLWVKITETHKPNKEGSAPFIHASEGYFVDAAPEDQDLLAREISRTVASYFSRFTQGTPAVAEHESLQAAAKGSTHGEASTQIAELATHAPEAQAQAQAAAGHDIAPSVVFGADSGADLSSIVESQAMGENSIANLDGGPYQESPYVKAAAEATGQTAARKPEVRTEPPGRAPSHKLVTRRKASQGLMLSEILTPTFLKSMALVAGIAFALATLLGLAYAFSERREKSGEAITDSLYRMAPHLKKKKKDRQTPSPFRRPTDQSTPSR